MSDNSSKNSSGVGRASTSTRTGNDGDKQDGYFDTGISANDGLNASGSEVRAPATNSSATSAQTGTSTAAAAAAGAVHKTSTTTARTKRKEWRPSLGIGGRNPLVGHISADDEVTVKCLRKFHPQMTLAKVEKSMRNITKGKRSAAPATAAGTASASSSSTKNGSTSTATSSSNCKTPAFSNDASSNTDDSATTKKRVASATDCVETEETKRDDASSNRNTFIRPEQLGFGPQTSAAGITAALETTEPLDPDDDDIGVDMIDRCIRIAAKKWNNPDFRRMLTPAVNMLNQAQRATSAAFTTQAIQSPRHIHDQAGASGGEMAAGTNNIVSGRKRCSSHPLSSRTAKKSKVAEAIESAPTILTTVLPTSFQQEHNDKPEGTADTGRYCNNDTASVPKGTDGNSGAVSSIGHSNNRSDDVTESDGEFGGVGNTDDNEYETATDPAGTGGDGEAANYSGHSNGVTACVTDSTGSDGCSLVVGASQSVTNTDSRTGNSSTRPTRRVRGGTASVLVSNTNEEEAGSPSTSSTGRAADLARPSGNNSSDTADVSNTGDDTRGVVTGRGNSSTVVTTRRSQRNVSDESDGIPADGARRSSGRTTTTGASCGTTGTRRMVSANRGNMSSSASTSHGSSTANDSGAVATNVDHGAGGTGVDVDLGPPPAPPLADGASHEELSEELHRVDIRIAELARGVIEENHNWKDNVRPVLGLAWNMLHLLGVVDKKDPASFSRRPSAKKLFKHYKHHEASIEFSIMMICICNYAIKRTVEGMWLATSSSANDFPFYKKIEVPFNTVSSRLYQFRKAYKAVDDPKMVADAIQKTENYTKTPTDVVRLYANFLNALDYHNLWFKDKNGVPQNFRKGGN